MWADHRIQAVAFEIAEKENVSPMELHLTHYAIEWAMYEKPSVVSITLFVMFWSLIICSSIACWIACCNAYLYHFWHCSPGYLKYCVLKITTQSIADILYRYSYMSKSIQTNTIFNPKSASNRKSQIGILQIVLPLLI